MVDPETPAGDGQPIGMGKPRLRGWLHAAMFPVAVCAGVALLVSAPTAPARVGAGVYVVTSSLLFGVSAAYHRGHWSARTVGLLRRLDHANIYLIIAGTYTPLAILALRDGLRVGVLSAVWFGAALGVVFRVLWLRAPRWLYTPLYVVLGWVAVAIIPQLLAGAGPVVLSLVIAGGLLYTVGGLVYALRRPDPSPRWFGFHEVFHALTVAAYATQFVAVFLVVRAA